MIGDVLAAQGDLSAALISYQAGLAIRDRLATSDSDDARWQRSQALSHERIGDVQKALGDLPAALTSYQAGLAIRDRVAKSDPGNAGWQRDLADSYYYIGGDQLAQGDLSAALASFQAGLAIFDRLAKADSGNVYWRNGLWLFYTGIGRIQMDQGNLSEALKTYDEAAKAGPKFADAYLNRGIAYLYSGNLAGALADVSRASELDSKNAYDALWVDIVGQRDNVPSRLSQAISTIDMSKWPAPIIRMFLGQTAPAAVLAAADDPDAIKKNGQVCEANFFSGELTLRRGQKEDAVRLFRLAANGCPEDFAEWSDAKLELTALGVGP
jgi:lipoprotein NlpI